MKLLLLGTLGCHLCEDAAAIVAAVVRSQVIIETIDIVEHEHWQETYAIRIPVLYHAGTQKELDWPFSQTQVETFINEINND